MAHDEFYQKNHEDWLNIHQSIFSTCIPSYAEWKQRNTIINVLNKIGSVSDSNHMFFPDGGGFDLEGAREGRENGCVEIDAGLVYILNPKELSFVSFDTSCEWNYFRIECNEIKPCGIYKPGEMGTDFQEECVELENGEYIHRNHWDSKEYQGRPLPNTARLVNRILKGALVIFKKTSIYNDTSETYDGRHQEMGKEAFYGYITEAAAINKVP